MFTSVEIKAFIGFFFVSTPGNRACSGYMDGIPMIYHRYGTSDPYGSNKDENKEGEYINGKNICIKIKLLRDISVWKTTRLHGLQE